MLSHALTASFADEAEQRVSDRRVLRLQAQIATPEGGGGIQVHNLSKTGMLVETEGSVVVGESIEVELPGGTSRRAEVVWADDTLFGCHFADPLTTAMLSAALLRAEPNAAAKPTTSISHNEAMEKLQTYWKHEHPLEQPQGGLKLPLGKRLWVIGSLGLLGWAVPAAAAYLIW